MKLYYSPASPFARKVRVLIAEKGIEGVEMVTVAPFDVPAELVATNPLSKVPALACDDGRMVYDSPVISEYLDVTSSGAPLLPLAGPDRWDVLRRQALADGLMDTTLSLAMEINRRPENERSPRWIERWVATIARTADALEAEVAGWPTTLDLGHIAAGCALSYLDLRASAHLDWRAGRPRLAAWYAQMAARPSMVSTAPPP